RPPRLPQRLRRHAGGPPVRRPPVLGVQHRRAERRRAGLVPAGGLPDAGRPRLPDGRGVHEPAVRPGPGRPGPGAGRPAAFAVVAVLWYLLRCRSVRRGWLCALLAFLGFANGLAPWTLRNYQAFHDVVPVADSMYLHLWVGNNEKATGGPQTEQEMKALLETQSPVNPEEGITNRYQELQAVTVQSKPHAILAPHVPPHAPHH